MTSHRLADMVGGWFVGDFEPSAVRTAGCEVASKHYPAGAVEAAHVHLVATEVTLIATGRVRMNGQTFASGDVIVLEPGETTDFTALEPTTTVVVKMPSVVGDRYLVEPGGLGEHSVRGSAERSTASGRGVKGVVG